MRSLIDHGVGHLEINYVKPIEEEISIVSVQADDGEARVIGNSANGFSIEILKDGKRVDSGFVFLLTT